MYPSTSLFIAIGQLAIVILVLFSYPLQVHPCRNCLDKIFHAADNKPVMPALGVEAEDEAWEISDRGIRLNEIWLIAVQQLVGGICIPLFEVRRR